MQLAMCRVHNYSKYTLFECMNVYLQDGFDGREINGSLLKIAFYCVLYCCVYVCCSVILAKSERRRSSYRVRFPVPATSYMPQLSVGFRLSCEVEQLSIPESLLYDATILRRFFL